MTALQPLWNCLVRPPPLHAKPRPLPLWSPGQRVGSIASVLIAACPVGVCNRFPFAPPFAPFRWPGHWGGVNPLANTFVAAVDCNASTIERNSPGHPPSPMPSTPHPVNPALVARPMPLALPSSMWSGRAGLALEGVDRALWLDPPPPHGGTGWGERSNDSPPPPQSQEGSNRVSR